MKAIFPNFYLNLNRENCRNALIFAQNYFKFFVYNCGTITQKNHKIALVKFCPQIGCNVDQNCANLQFSPRVVQFHFWPPRRYWRHLPMILSCRGERYGRLDTLNVKIHPLFQNLLAFLMEAKKWEKSEEHGTRNGGGILFIQKRIKNY